MNLTQKQIEVYLFFVKLSLEQGFQAPQIEQCYDDLIIFKTPYKSIDHMGEGHGDLLNATIEDIKAFYKRAVDFEYIAVEKDGRIDVEHCNKEYYFPMLDDYKKFQQYDEEFTKTFFIQNI